MKPLPSHLTGGHFLLTETDPSLVFTPEDLSTEERQIMDSAEKFMDKEVFTRLEALEHQEPGLAVKLFKQIGELGLHALEVPEEYGGLGLGKIASTGVAQQLSRLGGFGVTCGAHTGIGSMPTTYFGTAAQKQKYLPRLATGELMAAYCLSETGSGSDALGMKTKATLSADGKHYLLNGTKMWITNAGWADVFTVFAKVDGEHVTAFLVERTFPGVSFGKEEHKLGIKTSSTRRVILENAEVPVENVIGGVGKGAYIAFNILNFGRYSLGAGAVGGSADMLRTATKYAMERHQFGRPLASFGLIQQKLGDMAARIFAVDSAAYRTAANIDAVMATGETMDLTNPPFPRGMEEMAVECSIIKVTCSEALYYVTDEALQIHGGYGFTEEFTPARASRDARINRIFEGTNEINRLFITSTLLRRAQKGRFPIPTAPEKFVPAATDAEPLQKVESVLRGAKQLSLLLTGIAVKKFGDKFAEQQEVVAAISDMVMEIYLDESALLRTRKALSKGRSAGTMTDLTLALMNDSVSRLEQRAATVLAACTDGEELQRSLELSRRLLTWTPLNLIEVRRRIAARLCDVGNYPALVGG
ncbi:acyl-CoA dehydrogenase family protein [Schlesneria paludicola]|uniref:acyl-CoA dehydrogenase family protein n=1 Tax=Schlesneria paludicola TaxID=360056 RepID=UPI00029A24D2|nr:acyl-CoA dehydrogenase family protein [Schlesneria paludicola]